MSVIRCRTTSGWALLAALAIIALVALSAGPTGAHATTLAPMSVESMAQQATTVVRGTVVSTTPETLSDGTVRTAVRVRVTEQFKGSRASEKVVYVPGGTREDGMRYVVEGMASFHTGDECYVFADPNGWVIGGHQGKVGVGQGAVAETGTSVASLDARIQRALGSPVRAQAPFMSDAMPVHQVVFDADVLSAEAADPPVGAAASTWLSDGFEGGSVSAGWSILDPGTWGATSARKATGSYSAWCLGAYGGSVYPGNFKGRLVRGPYNLSGATGTPQLTADVWLQSELNYDFAQLLVSTDGVNYYGGAWSGSSNGWVPVSLELTNVYALGDVSKASQLYVMLAFTSDESIQTGEGAYFDNVALKTTAPAVTPAITTVSPNSGSAGTNTHIVITGTGFGSTAGDVEFSYGRRGVARISTNHISSWTDTRIDCEVPTRSIDGYPGAAGTGPLYVVRADGTESSGHAFTVPFAYGGAKWASPTTTYRVNTSGINAAQRESLIDAGAAVWNAAGSRFRFVDGGLSSATRVWDGVNVISWSNSVPYGVIALAGSWVEGQTILESDIAMSNSFAWGDGTNGTMDIQSIAEHELGHWLPLLDQYMPGDSGKVMYGMGDNGQVRRTLSSGDIAGIRWVYPASASTGTLSGTVTSSGGGAVSGATVSLSNGSSTVTNASGGYSITGIPAGSYTVTFSKSGFTTANAGVTVSGNTTTTRNQVLNPVQPGGAVTRVSGSDRFGTAAAIARSGWDPAGDKSWPGVEHVIIANGENGREADPLSAAGLAGVFDAPVLTISLTQVPSSVKTVITEIAAARRSEGKTLKVHLVGGTAAVPDARWTQIRAIPGVSGTKDRIYGANRYATSSAVANSMIQVVGADAIPGVILIAADNSSAYFDALSVSPIAYRNKMPMLSVQKGSVPFDVSMTLAGELYSKPRYAASSSAYIAGSLAGATRLTTSSNRYVASRQIATEAIARGWLDPGDVALASTIPDSLTGGAFLGRRGGPMLITGSTANINAEPLAFISANSSSISSGWILGGTAVVPNSQRDRFTSLIQ